MNRDDLLRRYCELFKKLYDPDLFHERFQGWLQHVDYFSPLYKNKKFDPKMFKYGARMIFFFMILATPAERGLFVKSLIETWKINPKLMRRAFGFLAQYHHFYDFVRRKLPGQI